MPHKNIGKQKNEIKKQDTGKGGTTLNVCVTYVTRHKISSFLFSYRSFISAQFPFIYFRNIPFINI